jgi:hypothetical protein
MNLHTKAFVLRGLAGTLQGIGVFQSPDGRGLNAGKMQQRLLFALPNESIMSAHSLSHWRELARRINQSNNKDPLESQPCDTPFVPALLIGVSHLAALAFQGRARWHSKAPSCRGISLAVGKQEGTAVSLLSLFTFHSPFLSTSLYHHLTSPHSLLHISAVSHPCIYPAQHLATLPTLNSWLL